MASQKADFIKVPVAEGSFQTMPVDEAKRIADSEIAIELCSEKDARTIVEGLYTCFPDDWWADKEPPELRPATHEIRLERMTKRLLGSFSQPGMYWIKAVHIPTGTITGAAGWASPSLPVHSILRRSALTFYGWQEKMGWTDAEVEEMWSHVNEERWSKHFEKDDEVRKELTGEPHWYLAPLFTWPEWQGRGVGKKLLSWAIDQADATVPPTPMYLESRPSARAVYMHVGFVPQGEYNFLRRGPRVVRGLEAEGGKQDVKKTEAADVEVVAREVEDELAS